MAYWRTANTIRTTWLKAPCRVLFACLLFIAIPLPGLAQDGPAVISFSSDERIDLQKPTYSDAAQRISVNAQLLIDAESSATLTVQVAENKTVTLDIKERSSYINGDRMFRAFGMVDLEFYSLSLMVGQQDLFGHLSSPMGNLQITAVAKGDAFEGWLYEPRGLQDEVAALTNDFVIHDTAAKNSLLKPQLDDFEKQAFINGSAVVQTESADAATTAFITQENFQLTQQFSRNPVTVGASVEAQVSFQNISGEFHRDLFVEFFFMLENSDLVVAPDNCSQRLSASEQKVLFCELGDFAPGQSKVLSYTLRTSAKSQPSVLSTAIVGSLRLDSYVNVVNDVLQDSDLDGLSDFNEAILGTDPTDANSVDNSITTIDVMALYTQGADELYLGGAETRINQLISVANQTYSDSGINITLRPVYHGLVSYNDNDDMDTALDALINRSDPAFASVDSLRAQFGADLVMLFRPLETDASRCGLATLGGFNTSGDFSAPTEAEFAFSHIGINCPVDIVVAHELGHNMGLTHSFIEDGVGGTFGYSTGYGIDGEFATIMATPSAFNTENRVARFSDPTVECFGFFCGVHASEEFGADAVQSLNIVRHQIAQYRQTVVPDLPSVEVSTLSGETTNAQLSVAATTDNGLSFTNQVRVNQPLSILAELMVDSRHLGESGSIHGLVAVPSQGFFQINKAGQLVEWDGTVPGLVDLAGTRQFRGRETLQIINNFKFEERFAGETITFYVAYRVPVFFNEIIYSSEPLVIEVLASP